MNEAIGGRAADALGPHDLLQIRGDLVQLVARALGHVRRVTDYPKPVGPRHHGARAALVLVVKRREVRIDAADLKRRGGGVRQLRANQRRDAEESPTGG